MSKRRVSDFVALASCDSVRINLETCDGGDARVAPCVLPWHCYNRVYVVLGGLARVEG